MLRGFDDFITGEDENEEEDDFKATEVEKNDEQGIYDSLQLLYCFLLLGSEKLLGSCKLCRKSSSCYISSWQASRIYPCGQGATKVDKATIRKRSKKFEVVDGMLHYKEEKGNSMNLRQGISFINCLHYK